MQERRLGVMGHTLERRPLNKPRLGVLTPLRWGLSFNVLLLLFLEGGVRWKTAALLADTGSGSHAFLPSRVQNPHQLPSEGQLRPGVGPPGSPSQNTRRRGGWES